MDDRIIYTDLNIVILVAAAVGSALLASIITCCACNAWHRRRAGQQNKNQINKTASRQDDAESNGQTKTEMKEVFTQQKIVAQVTPIAKASEKSRNTNGSRRTPDNYIDIDLSNDAGSPAVRQSNSQVRSKETPEHTTNSVDKASESRAHSIIEIHPNHSSESLDLYSKLGEPQRNLVNPYNMLPDELENEAKEDEKPVTLEVIDQPKDGAVSQGTESLEQPVKMPRLKAKRKSNIDQHDDKTQKDQTPEVAEAADAQTPAPQAAPAASETPEESPEESFGVEKVSLQAYAQVVKKSARKRSIDLSLDIDDSQQGEDNSRVTRSSHNYTNVTIDRPPSEETVNPYFELEKVDNEDEEMTDDRREG